MSNEIRITVVGRLTADPELRFLPNGAAVCNVTIASNARTFDKNTNEWRDEQASFWRGAVWRDAAENVAESLSKGMAVVATGYIKPREFEKDGVKRTTLDLEIEAIGPDLRWSVAKVSKAQCGQGGGFAAAPASDPWATPAQPRPQTGGWGQAPAHDEPRFAFPPNLIGA